MCNVFVVGLVLGSDGSGSKSKRIWKVGSVCSVSFLAPLHCYKDTGYCFLWTYVSGGTIRGRPTESSWQKSEWILLNEIWMFYLEIMRYGINSLYLVTCVTAYTFIQYIVCKYILLKFSLGVEFFLSLFMWIQEDWKAKRATQLVFCATSSPSNKCNRIL